MENKEKSWIKKVQDIEDKQVLIEKEKANALSERRDKIFNFINELSSLIKKTNTELKDSILSMEKQIQSLILKEDKESPLKEEIKLLDEKLSKIANTLEVLIESKREVSDDLELDKLDDAISDLSHSITEEEEIEERSFLDEINDLSNEDIGDIDDMDYQLPSSDLDHSEEIEERSFLDEINDLSNEDIGDIDDMDYQLPSSDLDGLLDNSGVDGILEDIDSSLVDSKNEISSVEDYFHSDFSNLKKTLAYVSLDSQNSNVFGDIMIYEADKDSEDGVLDLSFNKSFRRKKY